MDADAIPILAAVDGDAEFDATFTAYYPRIARVVARVVGDPGRAEELAVETFLRWWRHRAVRGSDAPGWLYRTAVRLGLDELRRQQRRARYERLMAALQPVPATPQDVHEADDERRRVRFVLARLRRREAALLLMRADGLSYEEVAVAMKLNQASIGTLISRAQRAFRTEYSRRYGTV